MKEIIKYQSNDGAEFINREDCLKYEEVCFRVSGILKRLPEKPDTCDFSNGDGFIQHDEKYFLEARKSLLVIAGEHIKHKWIEQSINDDTVDPSWAGRLIGEIGNKSLDKAWYRVSCTDKSYREFGQPYYVSNPDRATLNQINSI